MQLPVIESRLVGTHPEDLIVDMGPNELCGQRWTFVNMRLRESAVPNSPPKGPAILAAILRQYGAEVSILDLNAYRIKDDIAVKRNLPNGRHLSDEEAELLLARHLNKRGDQDVIAMSGMITTLRGQEAFAKSVRRLQPDCFLVSGGGLATELRTGLFNWIPELDAVAHSDGDAIVLSIGRDVKRIKEKGLRRAFQAGILSPYRLDEVSGRIRFMYEGQRPRDLDNLPYDAFDLLETDPDGRNLMEEVFIPTPIWGIAANNSSATPFITKRSLSTIATRGCPHACKYCFRGIFGEDRVYRVRSFRHLGRQILKFVQDYEVDFVGHSDDNFAIDKPNGHRLKDMPRVYRDLGINIRWGTHTRLDEADNRLVYMREAGCVYIGYGAESASAEVLESMGKGGYILKNGVIPVKVDGEVFSFPKTMVDGMLNTWANEIHGNCTWIMGWPGETLGHLRTSAAFIRWQMRNINPAAVNRRMFMATPYPGTEMFRDPYVQRKLTEVFGISFNEGEPVPDGAFRRFVLDLDDATKLMRGQDGQPLYFGAMSENELLRAREYADNDEADKIMDMS